MPTVQDRTSIANIALTYLGANRIQSFDQRTTEADAVRDLYEQAVRECLEDHPWNFAEKAVALVADATPARPDYDYSYNMPADHLATRWLMRDDGRRSEELFRMTDGDKLVTNLQNAWLVYTYRAGEHLFSPLFVAALAHLLAHRLAGILTESDTKVEGHYRLYLQTLARARNRNGQQDSPEQIDTSTLVRWHNG